MTDDHRSKTKHIVQLSKELLDDIELAGAPDESLLLKATRLARLAGSPKVRGWLRFEMTGYSPTDPRL